MLKHTFHARLSIWHLVLLVIILWLTHTAFAKQIAGPEGQVATTEAEIKTESRSR